MIIVVDTNIIISALITPNGRLAEVLTYQNAPIKRVSSYYLITELSRHFEKIVKQSKREAVRVNEDLHTYLHFITLYDETVILPEHWQEADRLTKDIDGDDILFIALTLQTGGVLWTGDKKLADHVKTLSFDRVVNTAELTALLNIE